MRLAMSSKPIGKSGGENICRKAASAVSPPRLPQWITISDADLKRAYEERRSRYMTPERRQLSQIVFPSMDDARAASLEPSNTT